MSLCRSVGTYRILLISFCPLDRIGGGETYTLETTRSILTTGAEVRLASPVGPLATNPSFAERRATPFLLTRFIAGAPCSQRLAWREILEQVCEVDAVWVHQYLACDHVFDMIGATACDQHLLLTSLGLEPRRTVFGGLFQPSPRHRCVEISEYAARRSRPFDRHARGVSAGIWAAAIRPPETQRDRFCALGRVLPHKGFEVTIAALPAGSGLDVLGPLDRDAPYGDHLRQTARGRDVQFHGAVPLPTRDTTLRHARAVVASSTHRLFDGTVIEQPELLGLVLLESLALGTLPIASDIPSFREIMEQLGLEAWLYPERDTSALAETLRRCLELSPTAYTELIQVAQERLRRSFLWDDYWGRVCAAWQSP